MTIKKNIRPATPWNVSIAKLMALEKAIFVADTDAMKQRWLFGRELASRRVDYKGQLIVPHDLMALTIEKCGLKQREITYRMKFAVRYPTKELCSDAIATYPSWYRMTHEGLKERSRSRKTRSVPRVIRRLSQELAKAFEQHAELSREDVKDLDQLLLMLRKILDQIDRNDAAKSERKAS